MSKWAGMLIHRLKMDRSSRESLIAEQSDENQWYIIIPTTLHVITPTAGRGMSQMEHNQSRKYVSKAKPGPPDKVVPGRDEFL